MNMLLNALVAAEVLLLPIQCWASGPDRSGSSALRLVKAEITKAETFRDCENCPEMTPVIVSINGIQKTLNISVYELTWKQYLESVDKAGCALPKNKRSGDDEPIPVSDAIRDDYPMTSIYPGEIDCYLKWISLIAHRNYRLMTSEEWMYVAAKGAGKGAIYAPMISDRDERLPDGSRFRGPRIGEDPREAVTSGRMDPVGRRRPNSLGLYDMLGNVSEVVSDTAPPFNQVERVMVKGGDEGSLPTDELISKKYYIIKNSIYSMAGYRIASDRE